MLAAKIAASIGASAARYGRNAGLGNACPIASKHSEQSQHEHDRSNDDSPFDEDVIAPVFWKRCIGLVHHAISHVVMGLPLASLPSLMTTPIAASSARISSDLAKFRSMRARPLSEIRRFTRVSNGSAFESTNDTTTWPNPPISAKIPRSCNSALELLALMEKLLALKFLKFVMSMRELANKFSLSGGTYPVTTDVKNPGRSS